MLFHHAAPRPHPHPPPKLFPFRKLPVRLSQKLDLNSLESAVKGDINEHGTQFVEKNKQHYNYEHLFSAFSHTNVTAFAWVYTRFICISLCYMAGIAFYDFLLVLISTDEKNLQLSSIFGAARHVRRIHLKLWILVTLIAVTVIITVKQLLHWTEGRYATAIHLEAMRLRFVETRLRNALNQKLHLPISSQSLGNFPTIGTETPSKTQFSPTNREINIGENKEAQSDSYIIQHVYPESDDELQTSNISKIEKILQRKSREGESIGSETESTPLLTTLPIGNYSGDSRMAVEKYGSTIDTSHAKQVSELRPSTPHTNDEEGYGMTSNVKPTLEAALLYRFTDILLYYLIFVAVFAVANTVQRAIDVGHPSYSILYSFGLLITSILITNLLWSHQNAIADRLIRYQMKLKRAELAPEISKLESKIHEHRILLAVWKKFGYYITGSFSYLVAYAIWATIQSIIVYKIQQREKYQVLYMWILTLCTLAFGAFTIIGITLRIRGNVVTTRMNQSPDSEPGANMSNRSPSSPRPGLDRVVTLSSPFAAHEHPASLMTKDWFSIPLGKLKRLNCFGNADRMSTSRLHLHLDIAEGTVMSERHQLAMECVSYLLALAVGNALCNSLPAVPSDAGTYLVQPTNSALIIYAFSCSSVLAIVTIGLERWIRREEIKCTELVSKATHENAQALLQAVAQPSKIESPIPTNPKKHNNDSVPVNPTKMIRPNGNDRHLLAEAFFHEYRIALATTLSQGFSLLVAYAWVGVFSFVVLPLLERIPFLDPVHDVLLRGVWALVMFAAYFLSVVAAWKLFPQENAWQEV